MKLLKQLIEIPAPSGDERALRDFIISYVESNSPKWKCAPKLIFDDGLQDNLILCFGNPRTAIFAHIDSIGFTTRYENQLVPIGGPDVKNGYRLVGEDGLGPIRCSLKVDEDGGVSHDFARAIERGTSLTWEPRLSIDKPFIEGTYLDNRLGVYSALKVAEGLEDGLIVFSTYEEHGGGSVPVLLDYIMKKHPIRHALISDITWVTEGVVHGGGVALSLRDKNIPRRHFVNRILKLAEESGIPYQLEVEGAGSSDGREVHHSHHPVDWMFIGAPEDNVHTPSEKVHLDDLQAMIEMYGYLMQHL